eukprot:TRINITY_DN25760_c0_g1_i1.p1 TRINITY_DN25760_c0_g1~~TRINITY_DN25760_c0_g1_i1.p1  ORF type:complete len:201 (-),score=31.24 TRINITY_DN25760_c0_g1_i1:140-670(-)
MARTFKRKKETSMLGLACQSVLTVVFQKMTEVRRQELKELPSQAVPRYPTRFLAQGAGPGAVGVELQKPRGSDGDETCSLPSTECRDEEPFSDSECDWTAAEKQSEDRSFGIDEEVALPTTCLHRRGSEDLMMDPCLSSVAKGCPTERPYLWLAAVDLVEMATPADPFEDAFGKLL